MILSRPPCMKLKNPFWMLPALILVFTGSFSLASSPKKKTAFSQPSLVVYSGRKEKFIRPILKKFERESGIKILLEPGKTGGLTNRLILEKSSPKADVFIATTTGAMAILHEKGVLQPYQSPFTKEYAQEFFDPEGYWTGITGRARVILYNTKQVGPKEVPKSIWDLASPKWKGKIVIASTREQTTLMWLSSLRVSLGEKEAKKFLENLLANEIQVLKDNTDVRRAVGRGEFAIGLTNSPNYYLQKETGDPVGVIFPDQKKKPGILVNLNSVALIHGSHQQESGRKLIDFLLQKENQEFLAQTAFEIPLHPKANSGEVLGLNDFRRQKFNQSELAQHAQTTLKKYPRFSRVGS